MILQNKKLGIFIIFLLFCFSAFSQEAVAKAVDSINKNYILGDYEKAYSYVLFVLKFYSSSEIPSETEAVLEKTVSAHAGNLLSKEKWDDILKVEKDLSTAPSSLQEKVKSAAAAAKAAKLKAEEEQKQLALEQQKLLEEEKKKQTAAEQQNQLNSILTLSRQFELEAAKLREQSVQASEEQQKEYEKKRLEAEEKYRAELFQTIQTINQTNTETITSVNENSRGMLLIFAIIIVIIVAVVVLLVLLIVKQQKIQHQQFEGTLKAFQSMRTASPSYDMLTLPFMETPSLPDSRRDVLMIGDSNSGSQAVSQFDASIPAQGNAASLKNLLASCQKYGNEIDKATGRRNASRRVADIVYKISQHLGYCEQDCILFFGVGLVYDIGFLNIESELLRAEYINKEQFEVIKTHTVNGTGMVFFIDEQYRTLFKDGVSKHHENLDGSGYPAGLKDGEIPYIARVLRVAESYVALISSREYKQIKDRNAAVSELRNQTFWYDQSIVDALDAVV